MRDDEKHVMPVCVRSESGSAVPKRITTSWMNNVSLLNWLLYELSNKGLKEDATFLFVPSCIRCIFLEDGLPGSYVSAYFVIRAKVAMRVISEHLKDGGLSGFIRVVHLSRHHLDLTYPHQ